MLRRPRRALGARVALVTSVALGAAACGPLRHGPPPAVVVFVNESLDQADVYASSPSAGEMRIGTVMPGRTERLRVSQALLGGSGTVTIAARLLARSRVLRTDLVTLNPGESVQITLPSTENLLTVLPVREP
jgi:hypothetical protein